MKGRDLREQLLLLTVVVMSSASVKSDVGDLDFGGCQILLGKNYNLVKSNENDTYFREKSESGRLVVITSREITEIVSGKDFSISSKANLSGEFYVRSYQFVPLKGKNDVDVSIIKMNAQKSVIFYGFGSDEVKSICESKPPVYE